MQTVLRFDFACSRLRWGVKNNIVLVNTLQIIQNKAAKAILDVPQAILDVPSALNTSADIFVVTFEFLPHGLISFWFDTDLIRLLVSPLTERLSS